MIIEICFLLFMLLYWFSEGCTEGYTWATAKQRKTNKLIFGHIKKGKPTGKGILDYHSWRLGENIGTVGCILGAYSLGIYMETNFYDLIKEIDSFFNYKLVIKKCFFEQALSYAYKYEVNDPANNYLIFDKFIIKGTQRKKINSETCVISIENFNQKYIV